MMLKEKIGLLGHIGAGSVIGCTPIGKETNDKQKWLNAIRIKHKQRANLINEPFTVLVASGEVIEGNNCKNHHKDINKAYVSDQIDDGVDIIMEYATPELRIIYLLYSHEYHEEMAHTIEIASKLELELRKKGYPTVVEALPQKETVFYGKNFRFIHGNGGSGKIRTSKLESNIKENLARVGLGDCPRIDYEFSSHTHRIATAQYGAIISHTVPCYKLMDTKGEQVNPDTWIPDIGMTIITFEERFGEIKVNIDDIIDKLPFRFDEIIKEKIQWEERIKSYEIPPKKTYEENHISKKQRVVEKTEIEKRHISRRE